MVTNSPSNIGTAATGKVLQGAGVGTENTFSTATFPSTATGTGKILIADGTNWVASTPTYPNTSASSGKILISDGTNFIASTPTYPSASGSAGTILRSDGTNNVYTTSTYPNTNAVSTLLYASSANVMGALATANSAILATNSSGVPSVTTASGNWLNTSRCCFSAHLGTDVTNVTGDGTVYTIIFGTTDFDQGSNYNATTGVFTAPVTGKYFFSAGYYTSSIGTSSSFAVGLVATGKTITNNFNYAAASRNVVSVVVSGIIAMTANDTCHVSATNSFGTKNDTISNTPTVGAADATFFHGYLVC